MEFFKCNSLIVQKTIHFIMVVADVSEIDIKHNTNYRSGFSLVGYSTTKIWNLCHVWDDFIVNEKSAHNGSNHWAKKRCSVCPCKRFLVSLYQSVCQLQAGMLRWRWPVPFSFRNPPQHKLRTTSLIIPDVKLQWLFFLAGWMTFNQQSEQQDLSLLLLQAESVMISSLYESYPLLPKPSSSTCSIVSSYHEKEQTFLPLLWGCIPLSFFFVMVLVFVTITEGSKQYMSGQSGSLTRSLPA